MPGYLLDTNHVSAMESKSPAFMARLASLGPTPQIRFSVVSLAEINWGLAVTQTTNQLRRDEFTRFVNSTVLPNILQVTGATSIEYVRVMAALWARFPPKQGIETERHLLTLGVDVNDVWIVATAMEHNLVLVTSDKLVNVRTAVPSLAVENWLSPPSGPP